MALRIMVRVRPCSPLARRLSSGRVTVNAPLATSTLTTGLKARDILPLGPSNLTVVPVTATLTFSGILTGSLPMRDMSAPLPNRADQLAADLLLAGLAVDHQSLAGGQDGDAEAVEDARDVVGGHVATQAGLADPLDVADGRLAVRAVLQDDGDAALAAVLVLEEVLDEALALEDLRQAQLQARGRDQHLLVTCRRGVADARQHVANGIGKAHRRSPLPARLDDAGDLALQRTLAEAEPAHLELAEEGARPSAERAAVVLAHLELQLALGLRHLGKLGHGGLLVPGALGAERHAEE